MEEPVAVTLLVIDALETLRVPYLIGGSLASAVHGVLRATHDADLVADLRPQHVEPLVEALGGAFYVEAGAIREAIGQQISFNVIHLETMFKVDVFVKRVRPFDEAQFQRRASHLIDADTDRTGYVASAEDTILTKLEWYRMGGEVSDRQWGDVLGVLKTQGENLDMEYLRKWATALGVEDLMEKALSQAQVGTS
ncbi:MAG: hypothetical protein HY318_14525 [Armatimonadetes bacterium]|nr:hypothetical protein [Armatimonadota bacterium]